MVAGRDVLDREAAVGVGDGEVGVVEDVDPAAHPGVPRVALELHQPRLAHRDRQLLPLDRHRHVEHGHARIVGVDVVQDGVVVHEGERRSHRQRLDVGRVAALLLIERCPRHRRRLAVIVSVLDEHDDVPQAAPLADDTDSLGASWPQVGASLVTAWGGELGRGAAEVDHAADRAVGERRSCEREQRDAQRCRGGARPPSYSPWALRRRRYANVRTRFTICSRCSAVRSTNCTPMPGLMLS